MTTTPPPPPSSQPPAGPNPAEWLDLYLDDVLDPAQRSAFEAEMARNPELRRAVELQREIDLSIKGAMVFDPASIRLDQPAPAAPVGRIGPGAAAPARLRPAQRYWRYGIAAAILLSLASIWSYSMIGDDTKYIEPGELYARMELNNFAPDFKCTTDAEFTAAVSRRLGSGLLVSHTPEIELLGWAYGNNYNGNIIGPRTLVLMCKLDAKDHALVLMDLAEDDRKLVLPKGSPLHLFRRTLGPLVLYELTPRSSESVLPKAFIPPIDCGDTIIKPPENAPPETPPTGGG